jgi:DNA-binding LacI/PurR family transcriptional regulator
VPQLQAIVCTNNFLAQGVLEALGDMENPPIIGVFDEIPTMNLLRFPIVCSMQDIPALADACVSQILRLLDDASEGPVRPIVLKARIVTNPAFEQLKARQGRELTAGKPAR